MNSKPDKNNNELSLEIISQRVDQHLKSLDAMEQIRWRFTSAFGITALLTLLYIGSRGGPTEIDDLDRIFAYLFVIAISISGLIVQIRIIGIFWGQWDRILELQKLEDKFFTRESSMSVIGRRAWMFVPVKAPFKSDWISHGFTVHGVNCLLFSILLSGSSVLLVKYLVQIVHDDFKHLESYCLENGLVVYTVIFLLVLGIAIGVSIYLSMLFYDRSKAASDYFD